MPKPGAATASPFNTLRDIATPHISDTNSMIAEAPWRLPSQEECVFYHAMDLPGGKHVPGLWDIRGRFAEYVGHYPLNGKTVLDVGTASGFLAFSAEAAGAQVTAFDADLGSRFIMIPFLRPGRIPRLHPEDQILGLKKSWWYSWHKLNSRAKAYYGDLWKLSDVGTFDVVIAGAILEHLPDPISAIGAVARCANEAVIIAFTPVADSDNQFMETANDWSRADIDYTWWTISRGLYRRVFDNLGFDITITKSRAVFGGITAERETIVAKRRAG